MTSISPWINFNGNAEEAFAFYKSIFGGEFTKLIRLKDLASPDFPVNDADAEKIMQIVLSINDKHMLIGNDVPTFLGTVNENEHRSKIRVVLDTKAEAEKVFNGLAQDGTIEAPIGDSPWGTYFGMLRDMYGIEWIIECNSGN